MDERARAVDNSVDNVDNTQKNAQICHGFS